ncbi:23S rRNA (cytidine-2'-O)-methyltransferase TlyA [Hippea sp. KM1]|uniref:23S rRNA (cytidine-2'-O)-methyltransferase TlyA n=1 Tax=Hippea sp. KM1 TaxID=944481 RepID=UPI00046D88FC|nr:TlyA family RNA methyltransferase [Hippea sp. KM1]
MRLDIYLVNKGVLPTRSKAKQIIESGGVCVNSKTITKPAFDVSDEDVIEVKDTLKYVSRGGLKLEFAMNAFSVDAKGKKCLDVGASTGGFTDCLIKGGAESVLAVDVGKDQLHPSLKNHPRVVSMEETDIRKLNINETFDLITVDVSFISLVHILKHIQRLLSKNGECVVLIKPQFEVGKGNTKKGIVRDEGLIRKAIERVKSSAQSCGFTIGGIVESPIKGKDGNREFLMHLKHG